jgi:very-short-patch-repair endonuclease
VLLQPSTPSCHDFNGGWRVRRAAEIDSDIRRARQLRTQMTDAEVRIWSGLRRWQMDGYRFRRQVPKGPYILDFVCLKARLVVEVDGGQHATAVEVDNQRTAWLESRGLRVLRFWNNDVLLETNGVLETIRAALPAPLTRPPRQAKRGLRRETRGD